MVLFDTDALGSIEIFEMMEIFETLYEMEGTDTVSLKSFLWLFFFLFRILPSLEQNRFSTFLTRMVMER